MEDGVLSIVCARWEPETASHEERDLLQLSIATTAVESGRAWFATVRAGGEQWLRFALLSTHTREEHVDALARELSIIAQRLWQVLGRTR